MLNRAKPYINVECITTQVYDTLEKDYVQNFECAFSNYLNTPLSIAVNQGRSALLLGLKILGVKKGDEVIVQSLICSVVIDTILELGAKPILVDNNISDYNVSTSEIEKKITFKTKAIIVAHLYGIPCEIEKICKIAKKNNCYLIEDCAQVLGAKYNGKYAGTFGDISFFSFNFDKPLSTGNGGMLVVNNKNLINIAESTKEQYKKVKYNDDLKIVYGLVIQYILTKRINYNKSLPVDYSLKLLHNDIKLFDSIDKLIRNKSTEQKIEDFILDYIDENKKNSMNKIYNNFYSALNFFMKKLPTTKKNPIDNEYLLMNNPRSLVGIINLELINHINKIRNGNAQLYASMLENNNHYLLPKLDCKKSPTYLRYTIINNNNIDIKDISELAKNKGYELSNYNWPRPIHRIYPYSKQLSYNRNELTSSEYLAHNLINLPLNHEVSEKDIKNIVNVLNKFN